MRQMLIYLMRLLVRWVGAMWLPKSTKDEVKPKSLQLGTDFYSVAGISEGGRNARKGLFLIGQL